MNVKEKLVRANKRVTSEEFDLIAYDIELLARLLNRVSSTEDCFAHDISSCIVDWNEDTIYWLQVQLDLMIDSLS